MDGIYMVQAAACFSAAFAIALGSFAPAYSQGLIGAKACESIGKYPESSNNIRMTMIFAMAIVESSAVYALLIAGFLVYKSFI